jgi:hypothetical protein
MSTAATPGTGATFGDELTLSGYSVPNKNGHTEVELHWKTLRKPSADYTVFVHAVDNKGGIAFQFDHVLKNASGSGTSSWAQGDNVNDWFSADLPRTCAPGVYPLRIGLYTWKPFKNILLTQTTLPRPGDEWKDRAVLIGNVECKVH